MKKSIFLFVLSLSFFVFGTLNCFARDFSSDDTDKKEYICVFVTNNSDGSFYRRQMSVKCPSQYVPVLLGNHYEGNSYYSYILELYDIKNSKFVSPSVSNDIYISCDGVSMPNIPFYYSYYETYEYNGKTTVRENGVSYSIFQNTHGYWDAFIEYGYNFSGNIPHFEYEVGNGKLSSYEQFISENHTVEDLGLTEYQSTLDVDYFTVLSDKHNTKFVETHFTDTSIKNFDFEISYNLFNSDYFSSNAVSSDYIYSTPFYTFPYSKGVSDSDYFCKSYLSYDISYHRDFLWNEFGLGERNYFLQDSENINIQSVIIRFRAKNDSAFGRWHYICFECDDLFHTSPPSIFYNDKNNPSFDYYELFDYFDNNCTYKTQFVESLKPPVDDENSGGSGGGSFDLPDVPSFDFDFGNSTDFNMQDLIVFVGAVPSLFAIIFSWLPSWCLTLIATCFALLVVFSVIKK